MDCREFIDRLDDFLEGKLSADGKRAAAEHLERCSDCRQLAGVLGDRALLQPPPDLVAAVLARTSGDTCGSARERVCDFVDGRLDPVDSQLVGAHLDGCEECSALSAAITRLSRELPSLAEMTPDRAFVPEVMARTVGRRRPVVRRAARVLAGWRAWVRRPRFALEAAYVGTCVLVLVFGIPSSPLAGIPRKALNVMTINPVAEVEQPLAGLERQVSTGVRTAWLAASYKIVGASREAADGSAELLATVKTRVGTFWDQLASEQETDDTDNTADDPSALQDQGDSK